MSSFCGCPHRVEVGCTAIFSARHGEHVGTDAQGNKYYRSKKNAGAKATSAQPERRWVIYNGANDASRVPPEWFSWLHHQIDEAPDAALPAPRAWEKPAEPNLTGTELAYRPPGALEKGARRAAATGDYEAWTPGA